MVGIVRKLNSLRIDRSKLFFYLSLLIKEHLDYSVIKFNVHSCGRICSDQLNSSF